MGRCFLGLSAVTSSKKLPTTTRYERTASFLSPLSRCFVQPHRARALGGPIANDLLHRPPSPATLGLHGGEERWRSSAEGRGHGGPARRGGVLSGLAEGRSPKPLSGSGERVEIGARAPVSHRDLVLVIGWGSDGRRGAIGVRFLVAAQGYGRTGIHQFLACCWLSLEGRWRRLEPGR